MLNTKIVQIFDALWVQKEIYHSASFYVKLILSRHIISVSNKNSIFNIQTSDSAGPQLIVAEDEKILVEEVVGDELVLQEKYELFIDENFA